MNHAKPSDVDENENILILRRIFGFRCENLVIVGQENELFEGEEGIKVLERATKQVEIVFTNVFNDKIDNLELECLNKGLKSLEFFGKLGDFGRSCCCWLNPRAKPT